MQVTVKRPARTVSKVRASTISRNADKVNYVGVVNGTAVTNVSDALNAIANKFFQDTDTPTTGVNEGDLWYDLTEAKLKLYDGAAWGLISGAATALEDEYFKFTSSSERASGYLAEFVNDTVTTFGVYYDGVVQMRDVGVTQPDVVIGGLLLSDGDLYIGK